jgi:hypothetical protein
MPTCNISAPVYFDSFSPKLPPEVWASWQCSEDLWMNEGLWYMQRSDLIDWLYGDLDDYKSKFLWRSLLGPVQLPRPNDLKGNGPIAVSGRDGPPPYFGYALSVAILDCLPWRLQAC